MTGKNVHKSIDLRMGKRWSLEQQDLCKKNKSRFISPIVKIILLK